MKKAMKNVKNDGHEENGKTLRKLLNGKHEHEDHDANERIDKDNNAKYEAKMKMGTVMRMMQKKKMMRELGLPKSWKQSLGLEDEGCGCMNLYNMIVCGNWGANSVPSQGQASAINVVDEVAYIHRLYRTFPQEPRRGCLSAWSRQLPSSVCTCCHKSDARPHHIGRRQCAATHAHVR